MNHPRPRIGGRPKGAKNKGDRATTLARKVLWGKKEGDELPRAQKLFEELLDGKLDTKEGELKLKALLALMGYGHDRPGQRAHAAEKPAAGRSVLVLPGKQSEQDWMLSHGQKEVVDMSLVEKVKPN